METEPQELLGRKRKRAGTLTARLHRHFIDYLTKHILPSREQILKAGFRFCNESTPNTVWVTKFRAWANNLAYDDVEQKLIFIKTGKEVIPREEFYNAVMTAHTERLGKHHNGLHKTDIKVQEKYTVGRRSFGMAKQFIREVVENCPDAYCQRKKLRMKKNGSDKKSIKQESQENDSDDDVDDVIDQDDNLDTPSLVPLSPASTVSSTSKQEQQQEISPIQSIPSDKNKSSKDVTLVQAGDQTLITGIPSASELDGAKRKRKKRKRKHKDPKRAAGEHKKPRTSPSKVKSIPPFDSKQHSQAQVMPHVPYMRLPDGSMMYNIDFKTATGTSVKSIKILPKPRLTNSGPGCSNRPSQQAKSKDKRLEFFKYFQLQPKDKEKLEAGELEQQSDDGNEKDGTCDVESKLDDTVEYGEAQESDENNNIIVETKEPVQPNIFGQKHPLLKFGTTDPQNPGKPAFVAVRGAHGTIILRPVGHLGPITTRSTAPPLEPAPVAPDPPALGERYEKIVSLIQDMKHDIRPTTVGNRGSTERLKRKITMTEDLIKNKIDAGVDRCKTQSNRNNSNHMEPTNPTVVDVNTKVDETLVSGPPVFPSNEQEYENILPRYNTETDNTEVHPSSDPLAICKMKSFESSKEQTCEGVSEEPNKKPVWPLYEHAIDLSIKAVKGLNARAHEAAVNMQNIAAKSTSGATDVQIPSSSFGQKTYRSKLSVRSPQINMMKPCTSTQNDDIDYLGDDFNDDLIKSALDEGIVDSHIPTSFDEVSSSTGDSHVINEPKEHDTDDPIITLEISSQEYTPPSIDDDSQPTLQEDIPELHEDDLQLVGTHKTNPQKSSGYQGKLTKQQQSSQKRLIEAKKQHELTQKRLKLQLEYLKLKHESMRLNKICMQKKTEILKKSMEIEQHALKYGMSSSKGNIGLSMLNDFRNVYKGLNDSDSDGGV